VDRLGGGEPVEVGTSGPGGLKDRFGHLLVLDEATIDPEVGVMLVILLGDQEFFGEFGYLCLIMG